MHAHANKNPGRLLSAWAPARPSGPTRGKRPLVAPPHPSIAIFAILASLACVSNGSPPPAPSKEAPTEDRGALQPVTPAPTQQQARARDNTSPGSNARPSGAELRQQLAPLPNSVLVGTDIVPIADYLDSAGVIPPSGTFRSEQGGATAEVRLESGSPGTTLTREFTEPGTKPQVRRYAGLQPGNGGVRLSGQDIEVLGATPGLLVLEQRSGVDGIPDSLWIEYSRATAGTPVKER
jgi:hypothetical protein